jgi:hypothetical protein
MPGTTGTSGCLLPLAEVVVPSDCVVLVVLSLVLAMVLPPVW